MDPNDKLPQRTADLTYRSARSETERKVLDVNAKYNKLAGIWVKASE